MNCTYDWLDWWLARSEMKQRQRDDAGVSRTEHDSSSKDPYITSLEKPTLSPPPPRGIRVCFILFLFIECMPLG